MTHLRDDERGGIACRIMQCITGRDAIQFVIHSYRLHDSCRRVLDTACLLQKSLLSETVADDQMAAS